MKGDENPGPSEDKHEELEKYHGKLIPSLNTFYSYECLPIHP